MGLWPGLGQLKSEIWDQRFVAGDFLVSVEGEEGWGWFVVLIVVSCRGWVCGMRCVGSTG